MDIKKYLSMIDHTLLRQDATCLDVENACEEAMLYGFCSVITQPFYTKKVSKLLSGSGVLCGTVAGFPFGCELTDVKVYQTRRACDFGAQEIDMVMAISAFKNGNYAYVAEDIAEVVKEARRPVKVIIETALLSPEEIVKACGICIEAGAHFAKTSTGYFGGGATVENVRLMHSVCKGKIKVKAAGGVRTAAELVSMAEAGAERIGTSGGVSIAKGLISDAKY